MKCSENSKSQIVFRTDIFRKLSLVAPEIYIIAIKRANFSTFWAISYDSRAHFFATAPLKRLTNKMALEIISLGDE